MKKCHARTFCLAVALLAAIAFCPSAALAGTITIEVPAGPVTVGSFFDVFVEIADVTDLYAFEFDLGFDPLILRADSVTEGSFLAGSGTTSFISGTIDNSGGSITYIANSLTGSGPGVTGDGSLVGIRLQALAAGPSSLTLSEVILLDSDLSDIGFTTRDGSITVAGNAVPEPCTMVLLCSGLIGMASIRRKIKK